MLLRSPISGAKKFFSKTLKTFKSFFNADTYEKLPKPTPTPFTLNQNPSNPNLHQHRAYDSRKLYIAEKWDSDNGTRKKISTEQVIPLKKKVDRNHHNKSKVVASNGPRVQGEGSTRSRSRGSVLKKLKELEMMDRSNIDHVMDIEEVLHYYSLLTCPSYLEIVDKFFVEIYADLFAPNTSTRRTPSNPSSTVRLGVGDGARVLPKVRLTERYAKYN